MTYIHRENLQCTPYQLFLDDLVKQLSTWRLAGDRLLLFIDANEPITNGPISRALQQRRLEMREVTHHFWDGVEPNTHINGSRSIDGIFATADIEITGFSSLSFHESVGDHRSMIVEISTRSAIGTFQGKIVRPTSRRLTTKQPGAIQAYNNQLQRQFTSHRIPERLSTLLDSASTLHPVDNAIACRIRNIHTEIDEYKTNAEAGCRKITKPALPYSPAVTFWYDQIHAYQTLIRIKSGTAGEHTDVSRAIRTAHRKKILNPRSITIDQCMDGIKVARAHQRELTETAEGERKDFLAKLARTAKMQGDEAREKAIVC